MITRLENLLLLSKLVPREEELWALRNTLGPKKPSLTQTGLIMTLFPSFEDGQKEDAIISLDNCVAT
jgi:hypothetical protein